MCNFVRRKAIIMAQKEYKDELKLDAFPEEVTEGGIRIYGETSYENQIATLSHYLHNTDFEGTHIEVQERRNEMMALIREYLEHKNQLQYYSDEDIAFAAENPFELDMFREFYEVPFPSPKHYEHTFIDLFAGIGGKHVRPILLTLVPFLLATSRKSLPSVFPSMMFCWQAFLVRHSASWARCRALQTRVEQCSLK